MARKTFINQTPYDLSVELTPRMGDAPGHEGTAVQFALKPQTQSQILYGDDKNPYLDGIMVKAHGEGNILTSTGKVVKRGSTVDNDFNTNDQVLVTMNRDWLVLTFRNG